MKLRSLALGLIATAIFAQGDLKINSDSYFDYFYSSNHSDAANNVDGFALRRVYLTFNKTLNDRLSARVRFEAAGSYFKNPGDKHYPFVKDMYLKYKMSDSETFTAGIQGHIILTNYEKFYGLRYVEKSPNDLYSFHSSREMGLSYSNKLSDSFTLTAMLSNGEGDKSEFNKGEMIATTAAFSSNGILAEVAASYNSEVKTNNVTVIQTLLGYKTDDFKTMVSAHLLESEDNATKAITQSKVLSVFGALSFDSSMFFARMDMNYNGVAKSPSYYSIEKNEQFNYIILGYEMKPEKFLYITPNFSFVSYDNSNIDSDFIGRVTLRLKW